MKKLFLLCFVLIAVASNAQQTINARRVTISENLKPPQDTSIAPAYLREVRYRVADTSWYVALALTGKRWHKMTIAPGDQSLFHDGRGKTYFISPSGSDANHGLTPDFPWQTIAKVNATTFKPGDQILFEGGQTFSGTITLTALDRGAPGFPVIISSYGSGRAKISSGAGHGIQLTNMEYVEMRKLELFGNSTISGAQSNDGIYIYQDQNIKDYLTHFVVDDCIIYSYSYKGINITSWDYVAGAPATAKSFDSVSFTHNDISDCGYAGIYSDGAWPAINHKNLYIAFNKIHHNPGNIGVTAYPTGSGVQIAGFDGGIIEYNEAYENGGGTAGFSSGGPVGIWCNDVAHIIIQYNESHHNHPNTGSPKDGGGFDMDGGATKCVTQYNYSHDNAGPGFMIWDYGSGLMDSLVVRYNLSINDANAAPAYGALYFGGEIAGNVKKIYVYNNTVYIDTSIEDVTPVGGRSGISFTALGVGTVAIDSFFFYNNIIYTNGATTIGGVTTPSITLGSSNLYYSPNAAEMNLSAFGKQLNPNFVQAGYAPSVIGVTSLMPPYRNPFLSLIGYTPRGSSPAIDSAQIFLYNTPKHDLIGTYIMTLQDIGALEAIAPITPQTTETIDFPNVSTNNYTDFPVTVIGAVDGDAIALGVPIVAYPAGSIYTAFVSAPGIVTIRLLNPTSGSVNPPSAVFKIRIIR